MKNSKRIVFGALIAASVFLASCENSPKVESSQDLLPKTLSVAIPSSLSNSTNASGGRLTGRTQGDTLSGNEIYQNLNTFIAVGAGAGIIVDEFIAGIRQYNIDRIKTLTYVSEDDQRSKTLIVNSDVSFEGATWDFEMTVTDDDSQGNSDGGKALQIFWNNSLPVKGVAIIKPYNCDRIKNAGSPDALFRIDYAADNKGYDATMEVQIAGLPLGNPIDQPFAMSSLHMFAGKKGDAVDVFGNSNHPQVAFFSENDPGFDWAFVASGSDSKNIGVAEVGLPPSKLDASDRNTLLKNYSIKSVFTTGINKAYPGIDPKLVANYLKNTDAPGYFNHDRGFIAAGTSPGSDWDILQARTTALSPYNPLAVSNLTISFK